MNTVWTCKLKIQVVISSSGIVQDIFDTLFGKFDLPINFAVILLLKELPIEILCKYFWNFIIIILFLSILLKI